MEKESGPCEYIAQFIIHYWIITFVAGVVCRLYIAANQRRIHVSVLESTQRFAQDFVEARVLVVGTTVTIDRHAMDECFLVAVVLHCKEPIRRVTAA